MTFLFDCRCKCENCQVLHSEPECICCKEVGAVENKITELESHQERTFRCITDSDAFISVCLNVWVLHGLDSSPSMEGNHLMVLSVKNTAILLIDSLFAGAMDFVGKRFALFYHLVQFLVFVHIFQTKLMTHTKDSVYRSWTKSKNLRKHSYWG